MLISPKVMAPFHIDRIGRTSGFSRASIILWCCRRQTPGGAAPGVYGEQMMGPSVTPPKLRRGEGTDAAGQGGEGETRLAGIGAEEEPSRWLQETQEAQDDGGWRRRRDGSPPQPAERAARRVDEANATRGRRLEGIGGRADRRRTRHRALDVANSGDMTAKTAELRRRGRRLEYLTIGWNAIEA